MAENSGPERKGKKAAGSARGRPFPKGKSGNPGGRPKELAEVKDLARGHTVLAIRTLAEIAKGARSAVARIMAAEALLNRAWGKPTLAVELTGKDGGPIRTEDARPDLSRLTDDQVEALESLLSAAADVGGGQGGEGSPPAQ